MYGIVYSLACKLRKFSGTMMNQGEKLDLYKCVSRIDQL